MPRLSPTVLVAALTAGLASCHEERPPPIRSPAPLEAPSTVPERASAGSASPSAPERSAEPTPVAPPVPRKDHQQADLDPNNDGIVAPPEPLFDCPERLTRAGVDFTAATIPLTRKRGNQFTCGAEQVVTYKGGPAGIRYNAAPTLTCRMALALNEFERIAQQEAEAEFGVRIARFRQMGTYSCRKMARFDFVSEHSYANAIDLEAVTLADGRRITVKEGFGRLDTAPSTREARFLRNLANRAYDEELFSVVLTPFWDRLHRDHLHLDLARYRVDGTRQ